MPTPRRVRLLPARRGFSLVGLLVTLVCILVLSVILMSSLNKAITGEGSTVDGTVRSVEDRMLLYALYQGLVVSAADHGGRYLVPSALGDGRDRSVDTTASFYSAMIMGDYARPEQLVSANERSGNVWPDEDYDYTAHDPAAGVHWDPAFMADLDDLSNVSFAHMPLCGERLRRHWASDSGARFPLLGNRGPRDGVNDPMSFTLGRNGRWGGHLAYGDGHIDFVDTFTPAALARRRGGEREPDNVFSMEEGADGGDAILSFTRAMTPDGPVLQFD